MGHLWVLFWKLLVNFQWDLYLGHFLAMEAILHAFQSVWKSRSALERVYFYDSFVLVLFHCPIFNVQLYDLVYGYTWPLIRAIYLERGWKNTKLFCTVFVSLSHHCNLNSLTNSFRNKRVKYWCLYLFFMKFESRLAIFYFLCGTICPNLRNYKVINHNCSLLELQPFFELLNGTIESSRLHRKHVTVVENSAITALHHPGWNFLFYLPGVFTSASVSLFSSVVRHALLCVIIHNQLIPLFIVEFCQAVPQ